jgi:hypothetical protein
MQFDGRRTTRVVADLPNIIRDLKDESDDLEKTDQ